MELFLPANTCPDSDAGSWERGGDAELVVARSRPTWGQSRVGGWRRRRGTWRPPGWCARPTEVGSTFKSSTSTSSTTSKPSEASTYCPTPKVKPTVKKQTCHRSFPSVLRCLFQSLASLAPSSGQQQKRVWSQCKNNLNKVKPASRCLFNVHPSPLQLHPLAVRHLDGPLVHLVVWVKLLQCWHQSDHLVVWVEVRVKWGSNLSG